MEQSLPWYRYPIVWLMIAPPLAAVIGGIAIVVMTIKAPDPVIPHDSYATSPSAGPIISDTGKAVWPGRER